MTETQWMLVTEVAERYAVSRSSVLQAWHAGNITGERVPRSADTPMAYIRISAESARAWFEGRPRQGVGAALDRLQARIAELEDALKPFAKCAVLTEWFEDSNSLFDLYDPCDDIGKLAAEDHITVAHLRRAADVLARREG